MLFTTLNSVEHQSLDMLNTLAIPANIQHTSIEVAKIDSVLPAVFPILINGRIKL